MVSPWFNLVSCYEMKVLGSHAPELHAYYRLECASGKIVGEEKSFTFSASFTALDCATLADECNVESAQAFRALVRACLVVPLQSMLFP